MVQFESIVVCLFSFSTFLSSAFATIELMNDFFPHLEGDLTKVTWAHAVNSQKELNKTLKGDVTMIEADVILGRSKKDPQAPVMPMMGHPPATESDLTLKEFLDFVTNSEPMKGIKLDFKSTEVFTAAEPILADYTQKTSVNLEYVPLWINADILPGPINSKVKPVDADIFLSSMNDKFPNVVISVGWTTEMSEKNSVGQYTVDHINNMTTALIRNRITRPVTFPVRAGLAAQSREALTSLIETSVPGSSLTIWMSNEHDPVSIPKLRCLIKTIGLNRTFIDVPDSIKKQLDLSNIQSANCVSEKQNSDAGIAGLNAYLLFAAIFATLYSSS